MAPLAPNAALEYWSPIYVLIVQIPLMAVLLVVCSVTRVITLSSVLAVVDSIFWIQSMAHVNNAQHLFLVLQDAVTKKPQPNASLITAQPSHPVITWSVSHAY